MSLNKLLLASAIAAASTASYAMEAMDDGSMSATSGQAGIDITVSTNLTGLDIILHDTNGFGTTYTGAGALRIAGAGISSDGAAGKVGMLIAVDAGSKATCTNTVCSALQISVSSTTTTVLNLGNISVAKSNRSGTTWGYNTSTNTATLVSLGSVQFNATSNLLNIQMGGGNTAPNDVAQGAWMKFGATFTGGVSLTGFTLNDLGGVASGGGIKSDLSIVGSGVAGGNLATDVSIDATTAGLVLTLNTVGDATNGVDVRMAGLMLGNTAGTAIGDVEIVGLKLSGTTVTVTGH